MPPPHPPPPLPRVSLAAASRWLPCLPGWRTASATRCTPTSWCCPAGSRWKRLRSRVRGWDAEEGAWVGERVEGEGRWAARAQVRRQKSGLHPHPPSPLPVFSPSPLQCERPTCCPQWRCCSGGLGSRRRRWRMCRRCVQSCCAPPAPPPCHTEVRRLGCTAGQSCAL